MITGKYIEEKIVKGLMYFSLFVVCGTALCIVATIIVKGWNCMSWESISSLPGGGFYIGKGGGFLNAIVGSIYIVVASTLLGLLISIPVVFYLNVYLKPTSKLAYIARLAFDILFGIPSIVYGAFAFMIMIWMGVAASLLGGIIVTTLLIIPILIRSMDEVAKTFPRDLLESSYALGATKLETIGIVFRQIAPGVATATLLSVGRAIGDAAGVMLTAGFADTIPTSLSQQTATLPLAIFNLITMPSADAQNKAYAAAIVLTLIVLVISLLGRFIMSYFSKNKI